MTVRRAKLAQGAVEGAVALAADRVAEVAAPHEDAGERILASRRVPCLCPEQARGACGRTRDYSTARGIVVERVACDRCPRRWTRVNT